MTIFLKILESVLNGFPIIYVFLNVTDKKRLPDWLSYVLGTCLLGFCAINNYFLYFYPTLTFVISILIILFLFSCDSLRKKILTLLVYILFFLIGEIFMQIVAAPLGITRESVGTYPEYILSFSGVLEPDLLMIGMMIYRKKQIKGVLLPVFILLLIPSLQFVYTWSLIYDNGRRLESLSVITVFFCLILNFLLIILFSRFIIKSRHVYESEKEIALIAQHELYDKDYFDFVQDEISKMSSIRHDVANYYEQIRFLMLENDAASTKLALELITELENRLNDEQVDR